MHLACLWPTNERQWTSHLENGSSIEFDCLQAQASFCRSYNFILLVNSSCTSDVYSLFIQSFTTGSFHFLFLVVSMSFQTQGYKSHQCLCIFGVLILKTLRTSGMQMVVSHSQRLHIQRGKTKLPTNNNTKLNQVKVQILDAASSEL